MAKGGALKPVYIVTDEELEINGGDFVLQQGPAMKVRGFTLDNYAGRKIQSGAAQPVYVVPEASAPSLYGGHWRVIAGQPIKVLSVTNAERNIIQGPAIPVYPVDDDGNYDANFAGGYAGKVLGYGPIAYWPMWEAAGIQAEDISGNGLHGTYTGVTLGQPGIGDGNTCPFFDGANDVVNINAIAPLLDLNLGSFISWSRVFNIGNWTDGFNRWILSIEYAGPLNQLDSRKSNINNRMYHNKRDDLGNQQHQQLAMVETGWMFHARTWSRAANQDFLYYQGAGVGGALACNLSTQNILNFAAIGAYNLVPAGVWHGWIAHCAFFNYVLTPAQILDLATV